jgi:hypothetical protein
MSIDRTSPSAPRCGWAVYYADRRIIVTSWYVETQNQRYRISDLADVAVVLDPRRGLRWREIRAVHRGTEVVLFGTGDRAQFERVRRALIRALEINRSPFP